MPSTPWPFVQPTQLVPAVLDLAAIDLVFLVLGDQHTGTLDLRNQTNRLELVSLVRCGHRSSRWTVIADTLRVLGRGKAGQGSVIAAYPAVQGLRTLLGRRLTGYHHATPDTLQRRFLSTGGLIINQGQTITIRLNRRTYSPVHRQADIPEVNVPWWDGRTLRFEYD